VTLFRTLAALGVLHLKLTFLYALWRDVVSDQPLLTRIIVGVVVSIRLVA
jgi:hypothetical protein